jgi:hypothetical protein
MRISDNVRFADRVSALFVDSDGMLRKKGQLPKHAAAVLTDSSCLFVAIIIVAPSVIRGK